MTLRPELVVRAFRYEPALEIALRREDSIRPHQACLLCRNGFEGADEMDRAGNQTEAGAWHEKEDRERSHDPAQC